MNALFPFQETGAAWLATQTRALLADEMGLGKTPQAVCALDRAGVAHAVIVCPASLRANWEREIATWSLGLWTFEILSYDMAARKGLPPGEAYVFDESQYLKTAASKRTKACLGATAKEAKIVWALSGTPAPNHVGELWTWLSFCGATRLSWLKFVERYTHTLNTTYGLKIMGNRQANMPELKAMVDPGMLRRLKADVLPDLPAIRWGDIALAAGVSHDIAAGYIDIGDELPPEDDQLARMRRLVGSAKAAPLGRVLIDELRETTEKLVVFGWHKDVLDVLHSHLSSFGVARIDGGTPGKKRQAEVDRFQNDPACRVFLGNIQAAGTGITLTASSSLVFAEMSWSPSDNAQAAMRVHRIGQTQPVLIRTATLRGSLDEAVNRVLARKTRNLEQLYRREAA